MGRRPSLVGKIKQVLCKKGGEKFKGGYDGRESSGLEIEKRGNGRGPST